MAVHNVFGTNGERIAKEYLEKKGYEILDENWIWRKAEIDLIALKDGIMVFAEVKTRSGSGFGPPEGFVNAAKRKLMQRAAEQYIFITDHKGEARFDIVSITFDRSEYEVNHIEDAFWSY